MSLALPAHRSARRGKEKAMTDPGTATSRTGGALALLALPLALALGTARPAGAESGTISGARTGPIFVNAGETLNVVDGAQISADSQNAAVVVQGGTVNVS